MNNVESVIYNNGDWKSVIQEIKFSDKELLKIRFTFNKQTGQGIIRHCTFYENYQDEWKRTMKDIIFEKLDYEPKFESLGNIEK